ncbi:ShlB/FhaC/HecB family hemolysin secretion/activation protein [Microbulbifer sp. 2205BS26-8]|uniref:ShlB/FhaC/HecB family hemolysin secretion/activation protein n=1 Tax=Microbulbifer sp. 2205BS26-8 TaxID=3064386 RepID=UPI00273F9BDD|nr:ShlB/FhaC/HecB family hemolysin secretion/activation protein [Microbulbifer sp. 2205BS26-8]MDP5210436.1 ShlB/FhaC/HecB family hemolysin secretion/activation protein [Microbulbifer sp. 2205BS26-8]
MPGLQKIKLALLVSITFVLPITPGQAQEDNAGFRSRVRDAFDQNTPTVNESDITKDFLQRTYEAEAPNLNTRIPEISRRNEGPRIAVKKFRFHRLEEYPDLGIDRETIEQLAESLRIQFMKEDKRLASGFTLEELEELAGLLDSMKAQLNPQGLGPAELIKLVSVIERQNEDRGLSYADLEEIAAELTGFYRRQGLFLAQVQIPAQDVENGVVTLTVQEGLLGQIVADDNDQYAQGKLVAPFEDQRGKLVNHADIESGLYLLNDLPALNVTGYFSAGENPGETKLNLKVRDTNRWKASFRVDNHGSLYTGAQRAYATIDWLNPLGIGDALTVGYLKSNPGSDDFVGSELAQLKYSFPLISPRTRVQLSTDYNDFGLYDEENENNIINVLDINGLNKSYTFSIDHKFIRSRDFNVTGSLALSDKESDIGGIPGLDRILSFTNDHVYGGEVGFYIDSLSNGFLSMLNIVNTTLQYGEHKNTVEKGRGDRFTKLSLNTSALIFLPMPFSDDHSRLILKSRAQYSDSNLPGFEQFSLGGANSVRAFSVRDFSADRGGVLSAEWYMSFPDAIDPELFGQRLNDMFQVALIADIGYGYVNNYEAGLKDDWARFSGAGMLFKFNWNDRFSSKVSVAWPLDSGSSIPNLTVGEDQPTVYTDFSVFYN